MSLVDNLLTVSKLRLNAKQRWLHPTLTPGYASFQPSWSKPEAMLLSMAAKNRDGCKAVGYCSQECQRRVQKRHKRTCACAGGVDAVTANGRADAGKRGTAKNSKEKNSKAKEPEDTIPALEPLRWESGHPGSPRQPHSTANTRPIDGGSADWLRWTPTIVNGGTYSIKIGNPDGTPVSTASKRSSVSASTGTGSDRGQPLWASSPLDRGAHWQSEESNMPCGAVVFCLVFLFSLVLNAVLVEAVDF